MGVVFWNATHLSEQKAIHLQQHLVKKTNCQISYVWCLRHRSAYEASPVASTQKRHVICNSIWQPKAKEKPMVQNLGTKPRSTCFISSCFVSLVQLSHKQGQKKNLYAWGTIRRSKLFFVLVAVSHTSMHYYTTIFFTSVHWFVLLLSFHGCAKSSASWGLSFSLTIKQERKPVHII